jgi:hypothetical protein
MRRCNKLPGMFERTIWLASLAIVAQLYTTRYKK